MTTPRWTKSVYVKLILAILVILCISTFVLLCSSYKLFSTSSISSSTLVNSAVEESRSSSNLKSLVELWLKGKLIFFIAQKIYNLLNYLYSPLSLWEMLMSYRVFELLARFTFLKMINSNVMKICKGWTVKIFI